MKSNRAQKKPSRLLYIQTIITIKLNPPAFFKATINFIKIKHFIYSNSSDPCPLVCPSVTVPSPYRPPTVTPPHRHRPVPDHLRPCPTMPDRARPYQTVPGRFGTVRLVRLRFGSTVGTVTVWFDKFKINLTFMNRIRYAYYF
jgi:hypothetical protein